MHIPYWLILTQSIFDLAAVVTIWFMLLTQKVFRRRVNDIDERLDEYNSPRSRVIVIPANRNN